MEKELMICLSCGNVEEYTMGLENGVLIFKLHRGRLEYELAEWDGVTDEPTCYACGNRMEEVTVDENTIRKILDMKEKERIEYILKGILKGEIPLPERYDDLKEFIEVMELVVPKDILGKVMSDEEVKTKVSVELL